MAYVYTSSSAHYSPRTNHKTIDYPLAEQDIIELHQTFLTNGFHAIKVANVQSGRLIINSLLSSLGTYHEVAVITYENISFNPPVFNMRQELADISYRSDNEQINEAYLEYFNLDFIWIEATPDLLESNWYINFEQKIKKLNLYLHMPIIYVSYDE